MTARARRLAVVALAAAALGCQSAPPNKEMRFWTDNFKIRVSSDPSPPYARERTLYKVVVLDKKTNQPVEGGEGRIFANTREGGKTWFPLDPGPELGTYYGTLNYVTAGEWAVAIEFRRDSTRRLERMDWMQEVMNAR